MPPAVAAAFPEADDLSTRSDDEATKTSSWPTPKRGGKSRLYGVFMGGGTLDEFYNLNRRAIFKTAFQIRGPKAMQSAQKVLFDFKTDDTKVKFDGKLEIPKESTLLGKELDKADFLRELKSTIRRFGLESFFSMPINGKMLSIVDEPQHFTVNSVTTEHEVRMEPPMDEISAITGVPLQHIVDRNFKKYDEYELADIYMSRLAVEALISRALETRIEIRFGHVIDFDDLPGQVYLMMILEICNASADLDIEAATDALDGLKLSTYPGEDIEGFATEAQRLIRVMQGGYALPYSTGSNLISKVTKTQCAYFNRTMFNYLDEVREMEDKVGASRDPRTLTLDPDYSRLSPMALCGILQEQYTKMRKRPNGWPALSSKLPEGNWVDTGDRRCYVCGDPDHLAPQCPKREAKKSDDDTDAKPKGNGGSGAPAKPKPDAIPPPAPQMLKAATWKYISPKDENQKVVMQDDKGEDLVFYWCSKCRCRKTGQVGFYTRHSTARHVDKAPTPASDDKPKESTPAAAANLSPVEKEKEAVANGDVDPDPDGLEFQGAYLAADDEPGVWLTATDEDLEDSLDLPSVLTVAGLALMLPIVPPVEDIASVKEVCHNLPLLLCQLCATPFPKLYPHHDHLSIHATNFSHDIHIDDDILDSDDDDDVVDEPLLVIVDAENGEVEEPSWPAFDHEAWRNLDWESPSPFATSVKSKSSSTTYLPCLAEYFDSLAWLPDTLPYSEFLDCEGDIFSMAPIINIDSDIFPAVHSDEPSSIPVDTSTDLSDTSETFHDSVSFIDDSQISSQESLVTDCPPMTSSYTAWSSVFVSIFTYWNTLTVWASCCIRFPFKVLHKVFSESYFLSAKCVLFHLAVFWDTLGRFYSPDDGFTLLPRPSRRARQKDKYRSHSSIPAYPRYWMILSCLMLSGSLSCFVHPSLQIITQLSNTSHRLDSLQYYVDFSPSVLYQYNHIRYLDFMDANKPDDAPPSLPEVELSFFDALEAFPATFLPQDNLHFFDSCSSSSEMEGACTLFDFHDAVLAPLPKPSLVFFEDIIDLPYHINWPGDEPADDILSLDTCPTPQAYNAALLGKVDLVPRDSPAAFKVIFDSGASLAISPSKEDFVGEIRRFPQERRLGGMAQGMAIEGVGYVHWSFKCGNTCMVIKAKCYYVPDSKARLISPQRLFRKEAGITGCFTCEESHASLTFNNLPPLTIDYDSRTNLPVLVTLNLNATFPSSMSHTRT